MTRRDPQLCVTVTGRTMEELRRARDAASNADLVELRLDSVDRPDALGAIEGRRRPVIVTCRAAWEGGGFAGSEEERERILSAAQAGGAEFIDVEARAEFVPAITRRRRGRGIVLSMHVFGEPPSDLADRARAMRSTGAEVIKIAIEARRLTDVLMLMDLAGRPEVATPEATAITCCWRWGSRASRRGSWPRAFGNRWTYAGDGDRAGTDAGVQASRRVPVSPHPARRGAVRRRREPDRAFPLAGHAQRGLRGAGVERGVRAARRPPTPTTSSRSRGRPTCAARASRPRSRWRCSGRSTRSTRWPQRVGAVNTLVARDGRWIGANTDVEGFLSPLAGRMALKGTRATVLGAGGAARAVAVALETQGAAVTVCARKADAARERRAARPRRPSGRGLRARAAGTCSSTPRRAAATARGDDPMAGVPLDGEIVFDLVYAPADTPLITRARAEGCLTIGGIEMLVAQAERQFELWTGQRPPAGLFSAAADARASSRHGR